MIAENVYRGEETRTISIAHESLKRSRHTLPLHDVKPLVRWEESRFGRGHSSSTKCIQMSNYPWQKTEGF